MWQVGAERHDAERGDATAATGRDVHTSGRRVETRQKPWTQVRREAWAARRLQALGKGTRRPQDRGRGSELRREVARRVKRLANFLAKTLTAWQSSLNRKSAADGVRKWQRRADAARLVTSNVRAALAAEEARTADRVALASVWREELSDSIVDALRQWRAEVYSIMEVLRQSHAKVSRAGSKVV